MPHPVPAIGPANARIMIVGEAPGNDEVFAGEPFVGVSGRELDRMLHEAGITRTSCFITNVCKYQPPRNDIERFLLKKGAGRDAGYSEYYGKWPSPEVLNGIGELKSEIQRVQPNIIIALGNTALWALTGHDGIGKWRGSLVEEILSGRCVKVLPTYHPAAILRQWSLRAIAVHDLRRAAAEEAFPEIRRPAYDFTVRPDFDKAISTLSMLQGDHNKIAVDIETRRGHIACIGFAWSKLDAICIPLMCVENPDGYWSEDEEYILVTAMRKLLMDPQKKIIGQNYLYDLQYLIRYWGAYHIPHSDTMAMQHVCWPGMPKGLDFLSSMYCEFHEYWKDEGKEWDPRYVSEEQLWLYNCKDAVKTYEVEEVLDNLIDKRGVRQPYEFQMRELYPTTLEMMLRGVLVDKKKKSEWGMELMDYQAKLEQQLIALTGFLHIGVKNPKTAKPWYRSSKQQMTLFYDELGIKEVRHRKTKRRTVDDKALDTIANREPLVYPIVHLLKQLRSISVYQSTFLSAQQGSDGRMRCSYNQAGPETFRYSSSKDAFGSGMNLQNIPRNKGED